MQSLVKFLLLVLITFSLFSSAQAKKKKPAVDCAICETVTDEIADRLKYDLKTPPGKWINTGVDWKESEERAVAALDGLCEKEMQGYGESDDGGAKKYVKFQSRRNNGPVSIGNMRMDTSITEALTNGCQLLLDRHRDQIQEAITTGLTRSQLKRRVCRSIAKSCKKDKDEL